METPGSKGAECKRARRLLRGGLPPPGTSSRWTIDETGRHDNIKQLMPSPEFHTVGSSMALVAIRMDTNYVPWSRKQTGPPNTSFCRMCRAPGPRPLEPILCKWGERMGVVFRLRAHPTVSSPRLFTPTRLFSARTSKATPAEASTSRKVDAWRTMPCSWRLPWKPTCPRTSLGREPERAGRSVLIDGVSRQNLGSLGWGARRAIGWQLVIVLVICLQLVIEDLNLR